MNRPDSDSDDPPLDSVLHAAVAELRAPVATRAQAIDALKATVRRAEHSSDASLPTRQRPTLRWFTTPRAWHVSPITLAAATLAIVIGVSTVTARFERHSAASAGINIANTDATSGAQVVRFTLTAPDARRVALVGDFNAWNPVATTLQLKDGVWTVVIPIAPGRHQYGFVVDGSTWIADPAAAQSADADFGSANSVVYVGS